MGYYTVLTLNVYSGFESLSESEKDLLEKEIDKLNVFDQECDLDFGYYGTSKWYDYDIDMLKLSMRFPSLVFAIYGEGESSEDLWYAYFKNGKMQYCPARIVYDEFSEDSLRYPKRNIDPSEKYSYQDRSF